MNGPIHLSRRTLLAAALASGAAAPLVACAPTQKAIRYGITPYQDSALPIVPGVKGWYQADHLDVQTVPLTWDQVMPALSSGAIDVAIYNFNSFIAPYAEAAQRPVKPLFYAPLYIFKGQAIMVHRDAGLITVASSGPHPDLAKIGAQLKGKRIALTQGTELEQIVLATLTAGGLTERDVTLIHASPEDSLAAFLSGNIDAFAAGLTERVQARRHGAVELVTQADVMSPVTDGLVTTDQFAANHPDILDQLLREWFRTIQYVSADLKADSAEIRDYLRRSASTIYSPAEYEIAWSFNVFPATPSATFSMFEDPKSQFYWKTAWDGVNRFLLNQRKISAPVPYSAYSGTQVLQRLSNSSREG